MSLQDILAKTSSEAEAATPIEAPTSNEESKEEAKEEKKEEEQKEEAAQGDFPFNGKIFYNAAGNQIKHDSFQYLPKNKEETEQLVFQKARGVI